MSTQEETPKTPVKFDFSAYPADSLFHERRTGRERRDETPVSKPVGERRQRKERRRRVDPTTFEKQYSVNEIEFMNAIQRFKIQTGRPFPTHAEVLRVAVALGYRQVSLGVPIEGLQNLAAAAPNFPPSTNPLPTRPKPRSCPSSALWGDSDDRIS